ncbi:sulfatase-like hydrolase/transferase [Lentisphaera marina]|uniref:sulfatase-like hydrolase/transferase n=1 Tax=Lentisphaera marina TaxID=1111041 RepID=UPI002366C740|nr:sulfatase-like hydrolase/transferase [Lentisphaera marina]MDD7984856.1 sulfatase-like hydrolase/transferase [Lentisphaera marina]
MIKKISLLLFSLFCLELSAQDKPNIIFILADDMGYGDMSNEGGLIPTPHLDRMANEGMKFTDAHTSSSVCTPTRYGILTGRYNWRSKLKKSVLGGTSPALIPQDRVTIANFLADQGYHTGMVGKWHLGIGWQMLDEAKKPEKSFLKEGYKVKKSRHAESWKVDYSKPAITPVHNGFDYFYGIAASLDMPPYVYIENDKAVEMATHERGFATPYRPGATGPSFDATYCLMTFADKSRKYIAQQAGDKSKPFFLYLPLTSPHTPIMPSENFKGKSPTKTEYGDFVMETDWVVGEVMAELDKQGIADNTLIIFTADNGCSPTGSIPEHIALGHYSNGKWRGHKADIFEGGHRVPFLVRWPAKVKGQTTSDSTICTTDFFATAADASQLTSSIKDTIAEDSFSFYADLTQTGKTKRSFTIHHSINGSFAIRQGKWKLNLCAGSGGWSEPRPNNTKGMPLIQLYDLDADPAEKNNLQAAHPEIVEKLVNQLAKEIKDGRSTPGSKQSNEGAIPFKKDILAKFPQLVQD